MNGTWKKGIAAVACSVGLLVAACSSDCGSKAPPAETGFVAENMVQARATVKSIDAAKRSVVLVNAEGKTLSVKVSENVDLAKVHPGDAVDIVYMESVAIDVADPGSAAPGVASGVLVTPAQQGQIPAGSVVQQVTATAEVTALDLPTYSVTLRMPDGDSKTFNVKNPTLQQKMQRLKVGDLVQITYTEALAIRVDPAATT